MKNILTLYKRVWRMPLASGLAIFFILADVSINLILPFIMRDVINNAVENNDLNYAIQKSLIMLGLVLVAIVCIISNNLFAQYVSQKITEDMRNETFIKIQALSFNNVDKLTTGRLITTVTNDCNQIQQILNMSFRILLRAPLLLTGGLVMVLFTSRMLFLIVIGALPILVIAAAMVMAKATGYFKQSQIQLDSLNNRLLENVSAAREIKTFVSENRERDKFEEVNKKYTDINIMVGKVMAFTNPIISIVTSLAIAGILYYGSILLNINLIDGPGDIMASIAYVNTILFGLVMVAMMLIYVSRAEVSARRINEVLHETIDLTNKDNAIKDFELKGEITFKDVSFAYIDEGKKDDTTDKGSQKEKNYTLRNISLTIRPHEVIGIIGSTGSGKTTLIQLIPRLYDVTEGELLIDGVNVKDYDIEKLRNQISFVTQESILFSGTIESNIRQGKEKATLEEIEQASVDSAANEFIQNKEDKFNSEVLQKGTNLSGGQRQRLALARAFVRKPKILILDDSTSAVDAKSEAYIKDSIKRLSQNMTTLIVAQKISTVRDLDRIIVLNNHGTVDAFGPHDEVLKISQVYREIYNSQYGGDDHE
jgi:ATP-binding cassette subfamily B protein